MKIHHTLIRLYLVGLTISALALGGCTETTGASSTTLHTSRVTTDQVPTQRITCESKSLDVPNIFADCVDLSDGEDNGDVSSFDDSFASRRSADEAGKLPALSTTLDVPARVEASIAAPYTVEEKDNPEGRLVCDMDVKGVELQGGTRYTITFDDVDHSGLSCLDFQPNVRIVSQEAYQDGDLSQALDLELIAPDPQSRYVSLSFVAPQDGVYCVLVGDTTTTPSDDPVEEDFCYVIYPDANKVGMSVVFSDESNGQSFTYTNEEVQDLRAVLRPYIESWDNGYPSKMSSKTINGQTWQEAFNEAIARIKLGHSIATDSVSASVNSKASTSDDNSDDSATVADSNTAVTVLEPVVDKQSWDSSSMDIGYGFNAVSGLPARKISALQPVTLSKERAPFSADTYMRLIENSIQQEQAMGTSLSATFSGSAATISGSASVRDVYEYSSTSTTLQIFYQNCATQPSKLTINNYKLNDEAKALLTQNPEAFRETYGDYFVAGAYFGAKYVGNIGIRCTSTERMNSVKQKLSAIVSSQKVDEELSRELKEVLKGCEISVSVHTEGGSDLPTDASGTEASASASDGGSEVLYYDAANGSWTSAGPVYTSDEDSNSLSIDALLKGYQNFKKSVEGSSNPNLTKIYAYMLEFSQLPECKVLSDELPVSPEVFISIRKICRDYLRLSSIVNEYSSLPVSDFRDGRAHIERVRSDFDDLSVRFRSALRMASNDTANFISTWSKSIGSALQTADNRLDRYYFVRRLSEAYAATGRDDLKPNRTVLLGYSKYLYSAVCNNDFIGTSQGSMHESWKIGRYDWHPRFKCSKKCSGIAAGIEWTNDSNCDNCEFTYFPPLCRQEVGMDCGGGYDRDVNWDAKVYWIDADNYKELILPSDRT